MKGCERKFLNIWFEIIINQLLPAKYLVGVHAISISKYHLDCHCGYFSFLWLIVGATKTGRQLMFYLSPFWQMSQYFQTGVQTTMGKRRAQQLTSVR